MCADATGIVLEVDVSEAEVGTQYAHMLSIDEAMRPTNSSASDAYMRVSVTFRDWGLELLREANTLLNN